MSPRAQLLLVLLATVAVFAPDPAAVFVWDDLDLIAKNAFVADWRNLPLFFTVDLWHGVPGEHTTTFYRPLMQVELLLDRTLFGLNPAAHQVHSLAWHLLATSLLWGLLKGRFPRGAVLGAALFALHPFQGEVARFVAARNDTMAIAGVLGCWLLAKKNPAASAAVLLLALFSKETALLALPGWLLWERGPPPRKTMIGWGVAVAVYALLRTLVDLDAPALTLQNAGEAAGYYAGCLISPVYCNPALSPATVQMQPEAQVSFALLVGLLAWRGRRGVAFALLAAVPGVLAATMSEGLGHRYMLFTLMGLAWAWAATLQAVPRVWPAWLLLPILAVGSREMLPRWADTATLWIEANNLHSSQRSRCGAFKALEERGDADAEAGLYLKLALPEPHCCYNASRYWLERDRPEDAVMLGRVALFEGCAPEPNLMAPLALAEALEGDWYAAEQHAGNGLDPYGYGPIVLSAAALRRGDDSVLEYWKTQGDGDLESQVQWVLSEGAP